MMRLQRLRRRLREGDTSDRIEVALYLAKIVRRQLGFR